MTGKGKTSAVARSRNAVSGVKKNAKRGKLKFQAGRGWIILLVFAVLLFMAGGIGYAWIGYERTRIGYEISELKREQMRLSELNRKLKVEIAMRKSPDRLESIAIERFGLTKPTPEQVVVLP